MLWKHRPDPLNYIRILLAIVSGVALTFAFPRWNIGIIVWLWILPLLYALWSVDVSEFKNSRSKSWFGFKLGYVAGLSFFIINLFWLRHSSRVISGAVDNTWMGLGTELTGMVAVLAMSAYLALYWGLWGAFTAMICKPRISVDGKPMTGDTGALFSASMESLRSASLTAAAWVACEWLRGTVLTGFGWNGLGVALRPSLVLIQSADMVGVTGLSFLPVFVACIGYCTVLRFRQEVRTSRVRPHFDFFVAVALLLLNFGYGAWQLVRVRDASIPLQVLLVQTNVSQAMKWSGEHTEKIYRGYGDLTQLFGGKMMEHAPDIVIWPESALPLPFHDPNHIPFLNEILSINDFSLLTGVDILIPNDPSYTGVALMRGNFENHQLYRKAHLVPFGEFLPLRYIWPVEKILGGMIPGDFAAGDSTEPLLLEKPEGVQIIPLVCFEDTIGRHARKFVREAPQILVNCTNDGWFLHSNENEVHLANAIFRCVELRRPMARVCNTGVTCVVDVMGRIPKGGTLQDSKGNVFIKGCLPKEIRLDKAPQITFYARYGDVFSMVMLGVSVAAILLYSVKHRKKTVNQI